MDVDNISRRLDDAATLAPTNPHLVADVRRRAARQHQFRVIAALGSAAVVVLVLAVASAALSARSHPSAGKGLGVAAQSSPPSTPSGTGHCHIGGAAARDYAVYAVAIREVTRGHLANVRTLFIATSLQDGQPDDARTTGELSVDVRACLGAGITGLPPIHFVTGLSDPRLPIRHGPASIPIIDHAKLVLLSHIHRDHQGQLTTSISVTGGGGLDFYGGRLALKMHGDSVLVDRWLSQWLA